MDRNSLGELEELKLSDLKQRSPTKSRTTKSHLSRVKDIYDTGKEWTDTASMDTDILVSQPIYGERPINMGGNLHRTLYEDQKVNRIKKESTKKLRKSSDKSRSRARERTHDRTPVSPRSKSVNFTPEHNSRPLSPRGYQSVPPKSREELERDSSPSRYRDYSPLRSGDHSRAPGRLELRPTQFSLPVRGPNFQSTQVQPRSPGFQSMQVQPRGTSFQSTQVQPRDNRTMSRTPSKYSSSVVTQSPPQSHSYEMSRSHARKSTSKPQSRKSTETKEGGESSDTDREMRKSPTGIRMEKMYREPTTMYPWKTMIQSHNHSASPSHNHQQSRSHKSVAFTDDYEYMHGKPVYESTPAVRNQVIEHREPGHIPLHDPNYTSVTGPREYVTQRVTQYFPKRTAGFNNALPPQPVFTSTENMSAIRNKPPLAPRSTPKGGGHRRSRTMPDLRKAGTKSRHIRHGTSRRSYDDDMLSIVTSDTDVLVTQPSMPIVDVSPSLTTVSDSSDTIVGSDTESEKESVIQRRRSQTPTMSKDDVTFDSAIDVRLEGEKFSPTSVFASSSPYAAVREELPKRYHLWKL